MALSRRRASGPKSLASATRKSRLAVLSSRSQAAKISRARATPEASPRRETRSRARAITSAAETGPDSAAGGRARTARPRSAIELIRSEKNEEGICDLPLDQRWQPHGDFRHEAEQEHC